MMLSLIKDIGIIDNIVLFKLCSNTSRSDISPHVKTAVSLVMVCVDQYG